MDFKYDPILGLQLTFGTEMFILDLNSSPEISTINIEEIFRLWHQKGVHFVDSAKQETKPIEIIPLITSNTENL